MSVTLRAFSALLNYPDATLQAAVPEIRSAITAEGLLHERQLDQLEPLLEEIGGGDLIACQEHYVRVFDRGRTHSLHLFEHVHGESRDRGQALVDLRRRYLAAGLEPATNELPDYLPLFLEYCSILPPDEARAELAAPGAILAVLADRLARHGTAYGAIPALLCDLAGVERDPSGVERGTEPDTGLEALDASWAEQEVSFGARAPAAACTASPVPPRAATMTTRQADSHTTTAPATATARSS